MTVFGSVHDYPSLNSNKFLDRLTSPLFPGLLQIFTNLFKDFNQSGASFSLHTIFSVISVQMFEIYQSDEFTGRSFSVKNITFHY